MNLEEVGSFKNKIVSKLINDDNILDVLLGDVDDIEDPETALLGKDGSGKGGIQPTSEPRHSWQDC